MVLFAGCSIASAQEATIGAGKVELGGFPGGGTFFTGGNDNDAVNFNTYTAGGDLTYYVTPKVAVEGELTGSVGWAQDVFYHNTKVIHVQMPNTWTMLGNVLVFPGGTAGKRAPFYITGGMGLVQLRSRMPTKQFGLDPATIGSVSYPSENIEFGVKIFRAADAPNWGFRVDYRLMIIQKSSSDPDFFAKSKGRTGHRVYVGMLYTWKR